MELITIQLDSCLKPSAAPCHTCNNIYKNPAIRLVNQFFINIKLSNVRIVPYSVYYNT
jgi:hypothetical protein